MKAYGHVILNGVDYCSEDENTLFSVFTAIQPSTPLRYGVDWVYGGDLDVEECDIYVLLDDGSHKSFAGVTGLNDFVEWYHKQQQ